MSETGFKTLCSVCWGSGVITFTDQRYSRGFGDYKDSIPCSCAPVSEPREYALREVRQRLAEAALQCEAWLDAHPIEDDETTAPTDSAVTLLAEMLRSRS